MNFKERIINGLYGCAVADAVGNPFEFQQNINSADVVKYANDSKKLVISDDTQMTMFGFESIKNTYGEVDQIKDSFTASYLDWYATQTKSSLNSSSHKSGLLSFKSMFSVQAPGNTCLYALKTIKNNGVVKNDSMGCGSVMRLLPLTVLFEDFNIETVVGLAQITGSITHKHRDNDKAIRRYMEVAYSIVNNIPVVNIHPDVTDISELGEGWIAPECVSMAIWAYTKTSTFDELLSLSIAHDGDSDSVAAVAGSLWGFSGRHIPQKYIDKLDALDAIKYVIDNYISKE